MIDDRQLLRLSRNIVAAFAALLGIWFLVEGLQLLIGMVQLLSLSSSGMVSVTLLVQLGLLLGAGCFFILRRNWLARRLIRPAPADTCPGCDYPIDPAANKCPECGLPLHQKSVGQASGLSEED